MVSRASDDHVVSQRANQCTSYRNERMILLSFAREAKHILHVVSQEATATSVFLRHIPKGDDVIGCKSISIIAKTRRHNFFLMLREALVLPGCNDSDSTIARGEEIELHPWFASLLPGSSRQDLSRTVLMLHGILHIPTQLCTEENISCATSMTWHLHSQSLPSGSYRDANGCSSEMPWTHSRKMQLSHGATLSEQQDWVRTRWHMKTSDYLFNCVTVLTS